MDLEKLELFLKIVETGSVTAAARQIHVTQPAASRGLKALEESLDVALFDRVGRGLVLSAAGRALRPRAEFLLRCAREAAEQTRLAAREAYFDVKLGTIDSLASNLFPRTIASVRRDFEGLEVQLSTDRTQSLLTSVREGRTDLVVVAMSGAPIAERVERIGPYSMKYYGRRDRFPQLCDVRHESELSAYPIVELQAQPGQPTLIGEEAASFARVGSMGTVRSLVLGGFGVGAMLDYMIQGAERDLVHTANVEHDPDCGLFLVESPYWRGGRSQEITTAFVEALRAALTRE